MNNEINPTKINPNEFISGTYIKSFSVVTNKKIDNVKISLAITVKTVIYFIFSIPWKTKLEIMLSQLQYQKLNNTIPSSGKTFQKKKQ